MPGRENAPGQLKKDEPFEPTFESVPGVEFVGETVPPDFPVVPDMGPITPGVPELPYTQEGYYAGQFVGPEPPPQWNMPGPTPYPTPNLQEEVIPQRVRGDVDAETWLGEAYGIGGGEPNVPDSELMGYFSRPVDTFSTNRGDVRLFILPSGRMIFLGPEGRVLVVTSKGEFYERGSPYGKFKQVNRIPRWVPKEALEYLRGG